MEHELTCVLCDNHCRLSELGCLKGQRFYEQGAAPYCSQCENHCLLEELCCQRGKDFYQKPGSGRGEEAGSVLYQEPPGLMMRFEIAAHQFGKVRGGQSSHMRVIRFLHNHGAVSQGELQLVLGIKAATMSELISRLEEQQMVTRTLSKMDRRVRVLHLTERGEEAFAQQTAMEEKLNLFSSLTDDEKAQMENLLGKLIGDWRKREKRSEEVIE